MSDDGRARKAGNRGRISISTILWMLVAVILLPGLIFSGIAFQRNNHAQQAMLTTLAEATAGSIAETVDRHVAGMVMTLKVFAASRAVEAADFASVYQRASTALAGTDTFLAGADAQMRLIFNTRAPFGSPLRDLTDQNTAERAIQTGAPAITGVFYGQTAQRWVFNVMLPVEANAGGLRLLILSQNVEALAGALAAHNLRGGWNAVIVDADGIVLASSETWAAVGKPFLLVDANRPASAGTTPVTVEHEGATYETIVARSELTGWQTIVWAPSDVVRAPIVSAMRTLAVGGMAVLAVGIVLAWVLGRRITGSVRRLAGDARRLGAGEHVAEVDYPVVEIATVSEALVQASKDRREAENEIRFLMREVAHRSKNQLTVVSSIAKQTARHARTFAAFQDSFQKRVQGLARSTDLLIAGGVAGIELRALVEAQLEPFRPNDASRIELTGAPFRLSHQAAQTLGLALHELATNAAKYGAFAWPDGRMKVSWKRSGDRLEFLWREFVPRMRRRGEGRGFGSEVIERMMGGALDAEIERTLHPDGLECRFSMPLSRLEPEAATPARATPAPPASPE